MLELRAENAGNEARARLRALAAEFPGALRELDRTPTDELQRRRDACEDAAAGGEAERWIGWMARYHELVRDSLTARRDGTAPARRASGRLNADVFERMAGELAVDAKTLADTLFPPRRR